MVITYSNKADKKLRQRALALAGKYQLDYVERKKQSIVRILADNHCEHCFVLKNNGLYLANAKSEFAWHPNTALLKLKAKGEGKLLKALALKPSDSVLDCTMGFASDSLVIASALCSGGKLVALESAKTIYILTREGLANTNYPEIKKLADRISLKHYNYSDFLEEQKADSFDVVYFDPMFEKNKHGSLALAELSAYANHQTISVKDIERALVIARKKVVIKMRFGSQLMNDLSDYQLIGERRLGKVVFLCFNIKK